MTFRILLLITTVSIISLSPYAQSLAPDTLRVNQYYAMGESLSQKGQYNQAISYYEKALPFYQKSGNKEKYVKSLNAIAESFLETDQLEKAIAYAQKALLIARKENISIEIALSLKILGNVSEIKNELDKALILLNEALDISKKVLGEQHLDIADLYNDIGLVYCDQDLIDEGLSYFEQALQIKKNLFGIQHESLATPYSNIGMAYHYKGLYSQSLVYQQKALKIWSINATANYRSIANCHNNIGMIYYGKGAFNKAVEHFQQSLATWKSISEKPYHYIGDAYNNIGVTYYRKGEYDKALSYYEEALHTKIATVGEDHGDVGSLYNNIGIIYKNKAAYDKAIHFYNKALQIRKRIFGELHREVADTYDNIGLLYNSQESYKQALLYYQKALAVRKETLDPDHPDIAYSYENLGIIHKEQKQYDKAMSYLQKSLVMTKAALGPIHPDVAFLYINLGDVFLQRKQFQEALSNYQYALIANTPHFSDSSIYANPRLQHYLDQNYLLKALKSKAIALRELYLEKKDIRSLKSSHQTFQTCDQLIGKIRHSYQYHEDKTDFGTMAFQVYQEAINTCYLLYKETNEYKYLEEAFSFSEQNKATVLSEKLSIQNVKQSVLSNKLVKLEEDLKIDRSFYYTQIEDMKAQGEGYDTAMFNNYQSSFFDINERLDSLKTVFQQHYPRYHQLKYVSNTITIDAVQSTLPENQALLSYFEGDSLIHVFAITQNDFQVFDIKKDSLLEQHVNQYLDSFNPPKVVSQPDLAYEQFTKSGNALYEALLAPVLPSLPAGVSHLTIIPDGKLSYVPWGLFISQLPDKNKALSYKNLNYLFNDYSISYAHSANLLFGDFYPNRNKIDGDILAFAPKYDETNNPDTYTAMSETFRDALVPLKWNSDEINGIEDYFEGSYLSGKMATEKAFKAQAGNYKILHLAMHALVDNDNAMMSKLVFTQDNDSIEDGMLHTYELFNMDLAAEMTVLSACNTGIGELQKGEGVMSLGRAFSYAGCPSIVMSHWSTPDQSTAQLMNYFYQALAEGKSKDVAMQEARKAFLQQPGEVNEHPLYWGGFVVLGDTRPITKETAPLIYWLIGLGIVLLGGVFVFKKKGHF